MSEWMIHPGPPLKPDEHPKELVISNGKRTVVYEPIETCERVFFKPTKVLVCSKCGAGMPKQLDKYCYLNYCPNCGRRIQQ